MWGCIRGTRLWRGMGAQMSDEGHVFPLIGHFCPVPVCFEVARHIEVAGVKKADVTESVVTKVRIGRNMKSKRKDVREYNAASGRKK